MIRVVRGGGLECPQPLLNRAPERPATRVMRVVGLGFMIWAFGSRLTVTKLRSKGLSEAIFSIESRFRDFAYLFDR